VRDLITLRSVVISVLLAAAGAGIFFAFTSSKDEPPPVRVGGAVEAVSPQPDTLALRQDTITADLAAGYTGVLLVRGVEIPEDQLHRTPGLNLVSYTPGPDTETGPLAPGKARLTVVYWPTAETREASSERFTWEITVH
jgi:hypothetical protein